MGMFRSREREGETLLALIERSPWVSQQPMVKQGLHCHGWKDGERERGFVWMLNYSVFVPSLFLSYLWDIKLKLTFCLFFSL